MRSIRVVGRRACNVGMWNKAWSIGVRIGGEDAECWEEDCCLKECESLKESVKH